MSYYGNGDIEEFEDFVCYAAEKRFSKKPGELLDMYAERVLDNVKSQKSEWMDYTAEDFLIEEGEDYVWSATCEAARDYRNLDVPMDADEFQYASLINFRDLANFIELDAFNPKSDFMKRWAEIDPKDYEGKDSLIFETYARGQIRGGVCDEIAEQIHSAYSWPDAEDIVNSKKDGTYAQLRGRFIDSVKSKNKYRDDDNDKGGM